MFNEYIAPQIMGMTEKITVKNNIIKLFFLTLFYEYYDLQFIICYNIYDVCFLECLSKYC